MLRTLLPATLALLACGCRLLVSHEPASLRAGDLRNWDIVVPARAAPAEQYAAEELQRLLGEAIGHTLPIIAEMELTRVGGHLFVGAGTAMWASEAGFAVADLGEEDLRIRVAADAIAIAGGSPRGTLYGVYTFLEDAFGVRFLAPECTHVRRAARDARLSLGERVFRPRLRFRYAYYGDNHRDHAFATRLRNNALTREPRLGGRTAWDLINHSVSGWVPVQRLGAQHPEYFALVDGRRRADVPDDHSGGGGTQPCMTHPEVRRLILRGALAQLDKEPWRANVSVSQTDNQTCCRCEACAAIDVREESHMGALLTLVNAVADTVAELRPGVAVGTLAYQYSRRPPKTLRPRPNVAIQLCSIECCVLHPIDDPACPLNPSFCADLAGWGRICDQVYVWNYNTNFRDYLAPCPNLRVIGPNVRYFVANGARGLFMQAAGGARGTDLQELRNYLVSRLLWDPAADENALMDEFITLYYGAAADAVRSYIALIHDNARDRGLHRNCFGQAADYGLDDALIASGRALLEEGMRRAETEESRRRVDRIALGLERAALEPLMQEVQALLERDAFGAVARPRRLRADARLAPALVERWRAPAALFFERCRAHQVNLLSETLPTDSAEALVRGAMGLAPDTP
jgi:hypothetical protein